MILSSAGVDPNFAMFGKKKEHTGSGHIKENTFGSSNEISFSVLDAKMKSVEDDSNEPKDKGKSPLGRISLFTLGKKKPSSTPSRDQLITPPTFIDNNAKGKTSGTGTSSGKTGKIDTAKVNQRPDGAPVPKWVVPQQEIEARKTKRRKARRSAVAVAVMVGAVCVAIGAFFGVQAIRHQMDFIGQLDDQINVIERQSQTMQPFIDLVNGIATKPLNEVEELSIETTFEGQKTMLGNVTRRLTDAKGEIERIQEHLVNPVDKERSNKALVVVNALSNMISIGDDIVAWCVPYTTDYALAQDFLTRLIEGDQLAREAASLTVEASRERFQESMNKSNEAIAKFEEALAAASALRDSSGIENMQQYIDYVDLRISAQRSAIDADQAYLNVNSARLIAANDEYNAKETQAAELAAAFNGEYPADLVSQRFEASRAENGDIASWESESARAFSQ